jgi:hypothetical protein
MAQPSKHNLFDRNKTITFVLESYILECILRSYLQPFLDHK